MKKLLLLLSTATLTIYSCQKSSNHLPPTSQTVTNTERGLGLDLNLTLDVDNTATEVMDVFDEIFAPTNLYVKIGPGYGGTDTAKKRAILSSIATHLGITLEDVNEMDGITLLEELFPDISNTQVTTLTSGNSEIVCIADDTNNTVEIYVGTIGAVDILTNPDFILTTNLL